MALATDRREFLRVNEAHELLDKAVANDSGRPTWKSLVRRISNIPSHSEWSENYGKKLNNQRYG